VSAGFDVKGEELRTFGAHLKKLEDEVRDSGSVVGSCVGDPGIFGIFLGQLFGAGASLHCDKARDQLNTYADRLARYREDLDKAIRKYEATEAEALNTISKLEV
jgi:hypothetical protein